MAPHQLSLVVRLGVGRWLRGGRAAASSSHRRLEASIVASPVMRTSDKRQGSMRRFEALSRVDGQSNSLRAEKWSPDAGDVAVERIRAAEQNTLDITVCRHQPLNITDLILNC